MSEKALGQLEQLLENQKQIMRQMHDIAVDIRLPQAWYLDAQCARLKGISRSFLSQNRWAQPGGGRQKKLIAGLMRNPRAVVKEWLDQADEELLRLYGTAEDLGKASASMRAAIMATARRAS